MESLAAARSSPASPKAPGDHLGRPTKQFVHVGSVLMASGSDWRLAYRLPELALLRFGLATDEWE